MHAARHYREQAERARRLAGNITRDDVSFTLRRLAQDFDELADDIERGAIEVRHPELMPQRGN